jgi:hypothetical protein
MLHIYIWHVSLCGEQIYRSLHYLVVNNCVAEWFRDRRGVSKMQLRNASAYRGRLWRYRFRLIYIGTALVMCVTLGVSFCIAPVYQASVALFFSLWAMFLLVVVYHRVGGTARRESVDERAPAEQETVLLASVTLPETPRPHMLARELSVGLERFVGIDASSEMVQVQTPARTLQPSLITLPFLEKEANVPGGDLLPPSAFKKGLDLPGQVQRSPSSGLRQYLNSGWQLE